MGHGVHQRPAVRLFAAVGAEETRAAQIKPIGPGLGASVSIWLMKLLIVQHLVIAVAAACDRRWGLCLYFAGAVVLSIGVLLMQVKRE